MANPKRLTPLCRSETLGARTGPLPCAMAARSSTVLPLTAGKSAGWPVASGCGGGLAGLLGGPQPATSAPALSSKRQRERCTRPECRPNRSTVAPHPTDTRTSDGGKALNGLAVAGVLAHPPEPEPLRLVGLALAHERLVLGDRQPQARAAAFRGDRRLQMGLERAQLA